MTEPTRRHLIVDGIVGFGPLLVLVASWWFFRSSACGWAALGWAGCTTSGAVVLPILRLWYKQQPAVKSSPKLEEITEEIEGAFDSLSARMKSGWTKAALWVTLDRDGTTGSGYFHATGEAGIKALRAESDRAFASLDKDNKKSVAKAEVEYKKALVKFESETKPRLVDEHEQVREVAERLEEVARELRQGRVGGVLMLPIPVGSKPLAGAFYVSSGRENEMREALHTETDALFAQVDKDMKEQYPC